MVVWCWVPATRTMNRPSTASPAIRNRTAPARSSQSRARSPYAVAEAWPRFNVASRARSAVRGSPAAIANSVLFRMIERRAVDPQVIRSIYKSQTFPTTGYGFAHNLTPALQARALEEPVYFEIDGHPNALGYAIIAEAMLEAIRAREVNAVPES